MLLFFKKNATKEEYARYEQLEDQHREQSDAYLEYLIATCKTFDIAVDLEYHPENRTQFYDPGRTKAKQLEQAVKEFKAAPDKQKEYWKARKEIDRLRNNLYELTGQQGALAFAIIDRYEHELNGDKGKLLADATLQAFDLVAGILDTIKESGMINRYPVEQLEKNINADFIICSVLGFSLNIAEAWGLDILKDIQRIAEEAYSQYKDDLLKLAEEAERIPADPGATDPAVDLAELKQDATLKILSNSVLYSDYFTVYSGKIFETLAGLNSNNILISTKDQTVLEKNDVQMIFEKLDETGLTGVNANKLLMVAAGQFTRDIPYNRKGNQLIVSTRVTIPLNEYLRCLKYDIDERETSTPEEAEKERKRVKNLVKSCQKRVADDLKALGAVKLTWHDTVKGKEQDFYETRLIQSWGIRNGYISVNLSTDLAEYLVQCPMIYYPTALLGVDPRAVNAYNIGLKLAKRASMDSNIRRGTANRLKIENLLKVTNIDIDNILENDIRHWERRIKDVFETALDKLVDVGLLSDWRYTLAKGEELTDSDAYNITDYETFRDLYLQFELADAPDHTERLQRKDEAIRKARKKRTAQKKKPAGKKK